MANFYTISNFNANGDSPIFRAKGFIITVGDADAQNYGGGTVKLFTRVSDADTWKPVPDADQFTAGINIKASALNDLPSADYKLTLAGATSPDLNYTINYTA